MIEFPRPVVRLIRTLNEAGYEAYAVGGCVRDALLGRQPNDWDLTTSALPEQIKACFANRRVIETGIKHGTVTVLDGGVPYEITTYRLDGAYSDHRRPDSVEFVSDLKEDLRRRDFTVNAMACHPETGVVDLFGGQDDLRAGIIRCVGEPEHRFTEDALRILRALRFASTYDFAIAPATGRAALKLAPTLQNVSPERIFVELKKLLCGKGARRVLAEYSDILFTIFPALAPMRGCAQNNPHHAYDVWTHTLIALENAPADPVYRLTMLFHDSGKPAAHTVGEDGYDHFKGHPAISRNIAEAAPFRHEERPRHDEPRAGTDYRARSAHSRRAEKRAPPDGAHRLRPVRSAVPRFPRRSARAESRDDSGEAAGGGSAGTRVPRGSRAKRVRENQRPRGERPRPDGARHHPVPTSAAR